MKWKVTIDCHNGVTTYDIPFEARQKVYYAHKKKWWKKNSKWVISACLITGIWATNMCGVILDDKEHIEYDRFDLLFTNKEEAIEFCIKKNAHAKVKIYGE